MCIVQEALKPLALMSASRERLVEWALFWAGAVSRINPTFAHRSFRNYW
jgi:hypothetical protein